MRTTVTLDPDTHALVQKLMRQRGLTFKQALNDAIRAGATRPPRSGVRYTIPRNLGRARFDVTKALQLAGELEDAETLRVLSQDS
jgi:hypothetical protein